MKTGKKLITQGAINITGEINLISTINIPMIQTQLQSHKGKVKGLVTVAF